VSAEPRRYRNRSPELLPQELDDARSAGVIPATFPGQHFNELVDQNRRLVYVLTLRFQLIIAPQLTGTFEIDHPALCQGEDVLAAGELDLVRIEREYVVMDLSNKSGHYRPDGSCLDLVREFMLDLGFQVLEEVLDPYTGT
jgi:hypothetical protein